MILKKEKLEKEILIHFSEKELKEYKIKICDIKKIGGCIKRFYNKENICPLREDNVYIFYFLYLEKTEEVLEINLILNNKNDILDKLKQKLEDTLKKKGLTKADVCVEIIIFKDDRLAEILLDKINKLIKESFSDESLDKIYKVMKRITLTLFSPISIGLILVVYTAFIDLYLSKIGIPLNLLDANIIEKFTKIILLLLYSVLTIVFSPFILISLGLLSIIVLLLLCIYFISKILGNGIFFHLKKHFFYKGVIEDFIIVSKLFISLMVLIVFLIIIGEPLVLFLNEIGIKNPPNFIRDFNTNVVKLATLEYLYKSYSDLRFIKVNHSIKALQVGTKNNLVYYYKIDDIISLLKKNVKGNLKICFCNELKKVEDNKNKFRSNNYRLFYSLFYLPSECGIYPYEKVLKEKLNTQPVLKVKIENLDKVEFIFRDIKNFCN